MTEFWMSYDLIAQRYGPGYQGYPLFGAVHWAELAATAALLLAVTRWSPPAAEPMPAAASSGA